MLVNKGDKIRLKKAFGVLKDNDIGKEYLITNVAENGSITFNIKVNFNGADVAGFCTVSPDELEEYFEEVVKAVPVEVSKYYTGNKLFDNILDYSEIESFSLFDKTTIVAVRFPNNYVIVESSSCVREDDYDEEIGIKLCMKRIEQKYLEHISFENCDDLSMWDSLVEYYDKDNESDCECNCKECNGSCNTGNVFQYDGIPITKDNYKEIIKEVLKSIGFDNNKNNID